MFPAGRASQARDDLPSLVVLRQCCKDGVRIGMAADLDVTAVRQFRDLLWRHQAERRWTVFFWRRELCQDGIANAGSFPVRQGLEAVQ